MLMKRLMLWELKTSAGFDDSSLFQTVLFEGWGLISLDTRVIAVLEQLYTRVGVGVQGSGFQSICSSSLFSGHPFASSVVIFQMCLWQDTTGCLVCFELVLERINWGQGREQLKDTNRQR